MYIKLCDTCGKPCEVDSGIHGGTIHADIMVNKGTYSQSVFREEFDVCIECLKKLGFSDILQKMKIMKDKNSEKKISFKKLLLDKKVLNT